MTRQKRELNQKHGGVQHIILSLLDSGLSIFHHSFIDEEIDPDLFSALITATSMQQKFSSNSNERALQEQYQIEKYVAHVCHGEYLAGIIVTASAVGTEIFDRFMKFLALFEEEYKFLLRNWYGDRTFFDQSWALDQLESSLFSPLEGYQLVSDAMEQAANARQLRLILLIQRYKHSDTFSKNHLIQLIGDDLQIQESTAERYVEELKDAGIIVEG